MDTASIPAVRHETLEIRSVADALIRAADRASGRSRYEDAAELLQAAARVLETQSRWLLHDDIERALQALAMAVPMVSPAAAPPSGPKVCLHVLTRAFSVGGHTAMAARWIESGVDGPSDIVLTGQASAVPERLTMAVSAQGGQITLLDPQMPILERAAALRRLARERASRVVLHVDAHDVIPALAFGVDDGPPVMIVNHAAHIYWVGGSVADRVLNCRGSDLEMVWTTKHRGLTRAGVVPIPLPQGVMTSPPSAERARHRKAARQQLGLPEGGRIILTSGDAYKYQPIDGLDFLNVCADLLSTHHDLLVIALGVVADGRWRSLSEQFGGRLRAMGRRSDVPLFLAAADLYAEGFPFGSTTALLEAGLAGLPVVLAPAECTPPFGSDGVAIDTTLARPVSVTAYGEAIAALLQDDVAREQVAGAFQASVSRHHTGTGWCDYVRRATAALPPRHTVQRQTTVVETAVEDYAYWHRFKKGSNSPPERWLDEYIKTRLQLGVRPRLVPILAAAAAAMQDRRGRSMPRPLLLALCRLLPLLPLRRAADVYATACDTFRPGSRTMRATASFIPSRFW